MNSVGIVYGIFDKTTGSCCYVGSSMDYCRRIIEHISRCNSPKHNDYKSPIYKYIRENGGFRCFEFKVLETVMDVGNKFELTAIEQKYIDDFVSAGVVLKNKAKTAKTPTICEHGVNGNRCRECGGASICEHNRHRHICKDCGGGSICEHNRQRSNCKDCGGVNICEHNRRRHNCKDCAGASICEHNRIRNKCRECGGASICEHNRRRSQCKECGGGSICEHNRVRYRCRECEPEKYQRRLEKQREKRRLKNR